MIAFILSALLSVDSLSTPSHLIDEVVVVSAATEGSKRSAKGQVASIDEHLAELSHVNLVRRGSYAWEPVVNNMQTERLSTTIDGMKIFYACTDKMDPVTSYVESSAGVAEGGRTGLTAVTVGVLFIVCLVFAPIVGVVQSYATAPALIIVGALMAEDMPSIDFKDMTEGLPAFLTIISMPLTYSIANGFGIGFISYVLLKTFTGRFREVSPVMWVVSVCFAISFIMR